MKTSDLKIPKEYTVGGQKITITEVKELPYDILGSFDMENAKIELKKSQEQSVKYNTFIHETVHSILTTAGYLKLNKDEAFVCTMTALILEIINSLKY